jgi:hypothetical protein
MFKYISVGIRLGLRACTLKLAKNACQREFKFSCRGAQGCAYLLLLSIERGQGSVVKPINALSNKWTGLGSARCDGRVKSRCMSEALRNVRLLATPLQTLQKARTSID